LPGLTYELSKRGGIVTELCYQHLSCRFDGEVLVMTLTEPELHGEEFCEALRAELMEAVAAEGASWVVLDLSQVSYVASLGLAALLHFRRHLLRRGGRLLLCSVSPDVADLLRFTHLSGVDAAPSSPLAVVPNLATALGRLSRF
jgi:anti-anti-sigma factor